MGRKKQTSDTELPTGIDRFLSIGLMIREDSKELLLRLIHLIRGHGIYKIRPSKDNKANYVPFVSAVHDGWKLAQNLITEKLVANLQQIESLEKEKQQFHKLHLKSEKDITVNLLKKLKLENLIFRRFIDSIVWSILDNEHSTIRRLPLKNIGDNLSVKNIVDARSTVDDYNKCPLTIAIISDITTFVHHGDIIRRSPSGVAFIELKSGTKGTSISRTANIIQELNCAIANEILTRDFNLKDKKQYTRTRNQIIRNENLANTLQTNAGIDAFSGLRVRIGESPVKLKFYSDELLECRKQLEKNGNFATTVIDDCLYVGMYKTLESAYIGFSSWMSVIECKSEIYNLTDSFFDPLSRPLPSLDMPTEFITEILNGDIIMVACLDITEFFKFSQKTYPNMITLKTPSNKINVGQMRVKGQALTMSLGDELGVGYLGDGLITRMAYDLQKPSSILKMHYAGSNHYYYLPWRPDAK